MYKYEQPSMFSGKRGVALAVVVLIHVIVGYGFYTGLAQHIINKVIPPVEIAEIEKPKVEDKPPPPPPKIEEMKPFVPPPEFVDVQAPVEQTQITQVATTNVPVAAPAPAAPPQVQHVSTHPMMDPKHPFNIGEDYYPDASKRAGEEGSCRMRLTVSPDGRVTDQQIVTGTGFPRLDDACIKAVKGKRAIPATEDGKPVTSTYDFLLTWKLKN
jgi:protein TonB